MKFEPGQLVKSAAVSTGSGLCIVIGEIPSTTGGSSHTYDVWSIKKQQKHMLHERYLSPMNPQEVQSGV